MSNYTDKLLSYGPIGLWKLDETSGATAYDISGNGYHGTYHGPTLGYTAGPDGELCPLFDGTNNYVDIHSAGLAAAFDADVGTALVWVKIDADTWTDGNERYAFYLTVNISNRIYIIKSVTNNKLQWAYRAGGVTETISKTAVTDTGWLCLVMTWDTTASKFIAYLNGVAVSGGLAIGGVWAGVPAKAEIGRREGSLYFDGNEAICAVFDKVLTPAQIALLSDASPDPEPALYIPQELYSIKIYDHTGTLLMLLQKWSRLGYHQRVNAPWNHQITLEYGYDDPDLEIIRQIQPDWIIEIHRIDPVTLVSSKVYEGFNTTVVDQVRTNGGIIINLYGVGFTQLLQRRLVKPPAGQEYSTKTNVAETAIKGFVSESMVSPVDTDRIFPGVSVAADTGTGNDIIYSARYTNLLSVCETISEQGNLDFGIYGGGLVGTFIFDARDVWGTDYTEGNPEGNIPVVFSIERDNMLIPILSNNYSAEQNYTYVGGEGQGAARTIQEVYDNEAVFRSPWSRKEVFVEARQQADLTALVATGQAELQNRSAKQSLSFKVLQTDSSRWLREWNLGDLITAKYYTYSFNKQITDIGVVVSSGGQFYEEITVSFEELRI